MSGKSKGLERFALRVTGGCPDGWPSGQKVVLYGATGPVELSLEEFAELYGEYVRNEHKGRGVILYYYEAEADEWHFVFMSSDFQVLLKGGVERAKCSADKKDAVVTYFGGDEGMTYEFTKRFAWDEFWRDCEGFNKKMMRELVEKAFPNMEVVDVKGI